MLDGGIKSTNIGLEFGMTIGDDATKNGKNTHLLVIVRVGLLQKIGLIQKRKRLETTYKNIHSYSGFNFMLHTRILLIHIQKCRAPGGVWGSVVPPLFLFCPPTHAKKQGMLSDPIYAFTHTPLTKCIIYIIFLTVGAPI